MKNYIFYLVISLIIICRVTCGIYIVEPNKNIKDGKSIFYWRIGIPNLSFYTSSESFLENKKVTPNEVGLFRPLNGEIQKRSIFSFSYNIGKSLHSSNSNTLGRYFDRTFDFFTNYFSGLSSKVFWETQVYSFPLFLVSILLSLWLIPYITLKKIEKKTLPLVNKQASIIVFETAYFLSHLPKIFIVEDQLYFINNKYSQPMTTINQNLIDTKIQELFLNNVWEYCYSYTTNKKRLVIKEMDRLKELVERFERVRISQTIYMDEEIIILVTDICMIIREFENLIYNSYIPDKRFLRTRYFYNPIFELHRIYKLLLQLFSYTIQRYNFEFKPSSTNRNETVI